MRGGKLRLYVFHMLRIHCSAEAEVAAGLLDIAGDLFAKGFGVGPVDFRAETVQEGQREWGLFS